MNEQPNIEIVFKKGDELIGISKIKIDFYGDVDTCFRINLYPMSLSLSNNSCSISFEIKFLSFGITLSFKNE
tara:strand:- start:48 stop:263 length:216 start_codon:yes stop_codon:yes gene_type:complete